MKVKIQIYIFTVYNIGKLDEELSVIQEELNLGAPSLFTCIDYEFENYNLHTHKKKKVLSKTFLILQGTQRLYIVMNLNKTQNLYSIDYVIEMVRGGLLYINWSKYKEW